MLDSHVNQIVLVILFIGLVVWQQTQIATLQTEINTFTYNLNISNVSNQVQGALRATETLQVDISNGLGLLSSYNDYEFSSCRFTDFLVPPPSRDNQSSLKSMARLFAASQLAMSFLSVMATFIWDFIFLWLGRCFCRCCSMWTELGCLKGGGKVQSPSAWRLVTFLGQ